ncbi:4-hydroxybenzoyl-CoA reductase subunit beta [Anaerolineae bacterium]|nr:4-hydroxybenzoyl-CoA reductase subunit beta [Anaerolineae bacterium]
MLRLPPFEYLAPQTLDDAVKLLTQYGADAMLVAGGTDLFPNMKRRQMTPKYIVGLNALRELRGVKNASGFVIGAGTTLTQLSNDPTIQQTYPALTTAAGLVSSPQLRNAGTIGGNLCLDTRCNYYDQSYFWRKAIGFCMKKDGDICLVAPGGNRCWAISSTDCAPVMVALDARVRLVGPNGAREIPASALYHDDGMNYLTKARDEILTEIVLPPADGLRSTYLKLRRRASIDFPLLGVATAIRVAPNGIVEHARIVLGAIASYPIEANAAEKILVGQKLTDDVIAAAADAAYKPAKPMDNADAAYAWRKKMVRVYVERALNQLAT